MPLQLFDAMGREGFEEVVALHDGASGARALVAVHDSQVGPAFGGIRRWTYEAESGALLDALRLSRAMSRKCALLHLPAGGGMVVLLDGEGLDLVAEGSARLSWGESTDRIVISGSSDVTLLSSIRGALLRLKEDLFSSQEAFVFGGDKRELFERRLLLIEHEIDGLLKRRINYTVKEGESGRVLDYTGILNEKENQIVELEKKIQNLEERLRRASKREGELEDEIVRLKGALKAVSNPSLSRADLDKLLTGAVEYQALEEKFGKLRAQFAAVGGLVCSQFDRLRTSGARLDQ